MTLYDFTFCSSIGAIFFCTYELTKTLIGQFLPNVHAPFVHMLGATAGEIVSLRRSNVNYI